VRPVTDDVTPDPIPHIPLNVRLRRHRGRHLAVGYQHTLELSPTAVFVWQQINGTATVSDISRALSEEYDVDTETARSDVRELLDELIEHDLVVWQSPRS
jgi:hypothetical protein